MRLGHFGLHTGITQALMWELRYSKQTWLSVLLAPMFECYWWQRQTDCATRFLELKQKLVLSVLLFVFHCLYCWIGHFWNVVELVKCSWIWTSNLLIIFLPYSVLLNFDMNSCQKELSLFPSLSEVFVLNPAEPHHNAIFINQEKKSSTL